MRVFSNDVEHRSLDLSPGLSSMSHMVVQQRFRPSKGHGGVDVLPSGRGQFATFSREPCVCAVMRTMFEGVDTTVADLQRPRCVHEPDVVIGVVD